MNKYTTKLENKDVCEYILLLIKCEKLHTKLEQIYAIPKAKQSHGIKNQTIKLNNILNKMLVKLMHFQWKLEL